MYDTITRKQAHNQEHHQGVKGRDNYNVIPTTTVSFSEGLALTGYASHLLVGALSEPVMT